MPILITQLSGSLHTIHSGNRSIDLLSLEWYETGKRILHKKTTAGKELILKFLNDHPGLAQDDVLYQNEDTVIAVDIRPSDTIVVRPNSMYQMACLCYEIGNRHMPLFFDNDEVLAPYEAPMFRLLVAGGFDPRKESRKLLHPLKTSVVPHGQSSSLFTKIMQLTNPSADA